MVYLQKINVDTGLPEKYRAGTHCIYCGKNHCQSNDECQSFKNGRNHNYFFVNGPQYELNLVTKKQYKEFRAGDPHYPEPTHLSYCPIVAKNSNPILHKYRQYFYIFLLLSLTLSTIHKNKVKSYLVPVTIIVLSLLMNNQVHAQSPNTDIENQLKLAQEKVEEVKKICTDFFVHFAPPTVGYVRYMDNITCFSIDYPSNWTISENYVEGSNVVLTDGKSSSITISQTPALKADNSSSFTLEDVKRAIVLRDMSIPNLADIPSLYEFQTSVVSDGNFLDNLPSIRADAFSDLGFIKIIRNLFATVATLPNFNELYVLTFNRNESQIDPSVLRHILESVHIMH